MIDTFRGRAMMEPDDVMLVIDPTADATETAGVWFGEHGVRSHQYIPSTAHHT